MSERRASVALEILEGCDPSQVAENLGRHERELFALEAGMALAEKQVSEATQALADTKQATGVSEIRELIAYANQRRGEVFPGIVATLEALRNELEGLRANAREIFNNLPVQNPDVTTQKALFFEVFPLNNAIPRIALDRWVDDFIKICKKQAE